MKTAVQAGLVALLAGATVLVAPAQAATIVQRTAVCQNGDFRGSFTLRYEISGGSYHLIERPFLKLKSATPRIRKELVYEAATQ